MANCTRYTTEVFRLMFSFLSLLISGWVACAPCMLLDWMEREEGFGTLTVSGTLYPLSRSTLGLLI